ncbi:MAG: RecA [uncultured Thermomicrobiales bacterium]|uniref:Protein RecA n=1 Tax=uncultured Thermomicrobiales bacterium TaxID=1645740 RepID=A0A6J4UQA7_9BACT|nr:MAG: RecA [uncultured Thermomicrobiales bacterium]
MAGQLSPTRRTRQIDDALAAIEARFGPGVVRRLRDIPPRDPTDRAIPSGSLGLDLATGLGGLPRGHVTELLGAESSGKTALLYAALAANQRAGGIVALIDAEGTVDAGALLACGVDLADLLLAHPASAPDALLMLTILAHCQALDALGLVSIPALRDLPAGRARGSLHGELAALDAARLLTRGLRVLAVALKDSPTAVILTNDLLPPMPDRPAFRSPGGLALRHHAALRVAVAPLALLPDGSGGYRALRVGLTIAKHKLGTPGGTAEIEVRLGGALDHAAEILRLGRAVGLVESGSTGLVWGAITLGRDEARARRALHTDADLARALHDAIRAAHGLPVAA